MKQGWEYKKLGEIGNIVTGSTPSTKDETNYSPRNIVLLNQAIYLPKE